MAAGDSGGYGRRDWAAVAAGLGVEASVESGGVVISGDGNGGRLLPLWSEEVSLLLLFCLIIRLLRYCIRLSYMYLYPTSLLFIYH